MKSNFQSLYVEEEKLLSEFGRVKEALVANCMDDDTFDAAKQTCLVLGGKLSEVRNDMQSMLINKIYLKDESSS